MSDLNNSFSQKSESISYFSDDQYFVKLFHNIPTPKSLSKFSDRTLVDVNSAWEQFTGFSKDKVIGLRVEDLNLIDIEKALQIRSVLEQEKFVNAFELQLNDKNGEIKYCFATFQYLEINGENYVQTTLLNITDQKNIEEKFRSEKKFSEELVYSLRHGLVVLNVEGEIIDVNPSFCKITKFKKSELIGAKAPFPFWPPESHDVIQECLKKTLKGEIGNFEFLFMRKGGERFPASLASSSIKNIDGLISAFFVTIDDITDQKKAEELIVKSKKYLDNIINNIGDPLFVKDDQSRLILVNDAFCELLNLSRNEIIGKTLAEDVPLIERETFLKIDQEVLLTGIENINEETLTFKGLDTRIIATRKTRFIDEMGNRFLIGIIRDITKRKKIERQLILANEQLSKSNNELNVLRQQLEQENIYLKNELELAFDYEDMVYGSLEFSNVLSDIEKVAVTNASVLILGETGTGKELLARAIHNTSLRKNKPLIKVNCSAIPRELIESELFGHKKGSFTGAFADKIGKFELAHEGTLFLDEIGELPLDMQPKILRFLQEGEIERIGATNSKKLDVRVIAATNRNLQEEIEKKQFREDLFFRLNVFPIEVPPLRNRKDDIPLLVEHFVDKFNKKYSKNIKFIGDAAMEKLKSYNWPGNIRELEHLIERGVILANTDILIIPGFESGDKKAKYNFKEKNLTLDAIQRKHILKVLEQCNWKINGPKGASELLGLKPSTLRDKISKFGIKRPNKNNGIPLNNQ